jgi:hypothetical protein
MITIPHGGSPEAVNAQPQGLPRRIWPDQQHRIGGFQNPMVEAKQTAAGGLQSCPFSFSGMQKIVYTIRLEHALSATLKRHAPSGEHGENEHSE